MFNNGTTYGSDDGVTANLTTSTNLRFQTNSSGFTDFWQVVEYDSCIVQKITSPDLTGTTVSSTITGVNTAKTRVVCSHRNSTNVNADDLPRTELVNSTTLTHTRLGSSGTLVFVSYIIEFTDNTTVKRASLSFASGDMSLRDTLGTALNDSSSIVNGPGNFGRQGSTNFASSDNMGYGWFAYDLLNDSVVEVSRANTGSAATAPYEAVSFRYDQTRAPYLSDANPVGPYDDAQVRSIQRGSVSLGTAAWQLVTFKRGEEPLPLELLYFKIIDQTASNLKLEWASASEMNVSHFELEQSIDAFSFELVNIIPAKGNSNKLRTYNDELALDKPGTYYFRLKIVDVDGSFEYSEVLATEINAKGNYGLFPNPSQSYFNVENKSDELLKYELRNSQGVLHEEGFLNSKEKVKIGENIPAGSCFVSLVSKQFRQIEVVLKL